MAKVIKTCPVCGKEYETYRTNQKVCSVKCRDLYIRDKFSKIPSKKIKRKCAICGKDFEVYPIALKRDRGKYCSRECYLKKKNAFLPHYKSLMNVLHCMKLRCYNPKTKSYSDYGARGIKICSDWLEDKMNFYNWAISNDYNPNLTIDRIDVNGDYEPSNCQWIPKSEQAKNRRCNIMICLTEICRILNLPYKTINARVKRYKWSIEKALTTPIK